MDRRELGADDEPRIAWAKEIVAVAELPICASSRA
jgi:hypothetical protein